VIESCLLRSKRCCAALSEERRVNRKRVLTAKVVLIFVLLPDKQKLPPDTPYWALDPPCSSQKARCCRQRRTSPRTSKKSRSIVMDICALSVLPAMLLLSLSTPSCPSLQSAQPLVMYTSMVNLLSNSPYQSAEPALRHLRRLSNSWYSTQAITGLLLLMRAIPFTASRYNLSPISQIHLRIHPCRLEKARIRCMEPSLPLTSRYQVQLICSSR
jgi:hypothetical protein